MRKQPVTFVLLILILLVVTGSFISCPENSTVNKSGLSRYRLHEPDKIHSLPSQLTEVSGLTDLNSSQIACVQDEKGIVFTYDLSEGRVMEEIPFAEDSDYEGLTRVNNLLFSLSSEGTLFEIRSGHKESETVRYDLELPAADNEGLCYDEQHNQLLIAPKSKPWKGEEFKDVRAIFAFDLKKRKMKEEPLFYFSSAAIFAFAENQHLPYKPSYKKNGTPNPNFRPSSLAVHPVSDEIYVLSAEDHCLAVFDRKGNITGFSALDPELFPKAEGITFLRDGTLIITNEGVDGAATLVIFEMQQ